MVAPKTPNLDKLSAAKEHFSSRVERPLLIVGNGPSAALPRYRDLPSDPVVFRMNWFFLEDHYYYGDQVDGYFWSVNNRALHEGLASIVKERSYKLDAFFCPFRVPEEAKDIFDIYDVLFEPQFDQWMLLAEYPMLARYLMSRPLPTQGFQALATGLALGFKDVTLTGFDLYSDPKRRYGYAVPEHIAGKLEAKDLRGGYEDAHSLAHDLAFLSDLLRLFPDAEVGAVGCNALISDRLAHKPSRPRTGAKMRVSPKSAQRTKNVLFTPKSEIKKDWYAIRGGKRCAYVTLCTGDFHWGVAALENSLKAVTDTPLVVLTTPQTELSRFQHLASPVLTIAPIANPHSKRDRFADTYTKLTVFGLDQWDELIFLDADTLVLNDIDHMFDLEGFWAAPDIGLTVNDQQFNSGVFKLTPSSDLLDDMLRQVPMLDSDDGGDQGFLNRYIESWGRLPTAYNTLRRVYDSAPSLFRDGEVNVVHYVGPKPWHTYDRKNNEFKAVDELWYEFLRPEQLRALCAYMRALPIRAKDERFAAKALDEMIVYGSRSIEAQDEEAAKPRAALGEAELLIAAGEFQRALETSLAAVERTPSSTKHMALIIKCHKQLGNFAEARDWQARRREELDRRASL